MTAQIERGEPRGPVRPAERALAPDLARGSMLLFIALANVLGVAFASAPGVDPAVRAGTGLGPLDDTLNFLMFTLVHARAYPMFAVMFGYGLVQLSRRQQAAGASPARVRSVLLRRNGWLVAFGLAHAVLLYSGDFLGAYGIVGIVMTLVLLRRGERVHRIVLWIWALSLVEVLVVAGLVVRGVLGGPVGAPALSIVRTDSLAATDYLRGLRERVLEWPAHTAFVTGFIMIVWLGTWAARRRILEEPGRHLPLLRRAASLGLAIAVLGGLPMALEVVGVLHVDADTADRIAMLFDASGMFGGVGYVALFGLMAHRLMRTGRGPVVRALCALGQRSLSGYLFQSLAWLVLLAPYTLALGGRLGSPTATALLLGAGVWLVSVLGADQLARRGRQGPAELVLRRLTYGPTRAEVRRGGTPAGTTDGPAATGSHRRGE